MQCISPESVRRPGGKGSGDRITVPCGVCFYCLRNKQNSWSIRLNEQLKKSDFSHFVTLTYDDNHIKWIFPDYPESSCLFEEAVKTDDFSYRIPTFSKIDVQLFLKRLRDFYPKVGVKYYLVSEYGSETKRPHYHAIFFNIPEEISDIVSLKKFTVTLTKIWKNGMVHVGNVTPKSIAYVTKYLINSDDIPKNYSRPFALISKGLGKGYLSEKIKTYHQEAQRFYYTTEQEIKVNLPRYYREKIFTDYEKRLNALKIQNEHKCDDKSDQYGLYERKINRSKLITKRKKL